MLKVRQECLVADRKLSTPSPGAETWGPQAGGAVSEASRLVPRPRGLGGLTWQESTFPSR